jgi:hypothetical protein
MACCATCGAPSATTAVIGLGATYAYLDVCDEHLSDLLRNARPTGDRVESLSTPRGERNRLQIET